MRFAGNWKFILITCLLLLQGITLRAQQPTRYSSSDIQLLVDKLDVLGNCLYLAAHPDDENQRVIGYVAQEMKLNSAYLSLTRGDGGQNLIGPEIRDGLGVIRANELLMARSVDGSSQYFSRANDFGYSKTAEETFQVWDRDQVMEDVVYVIRKFRPDVIITRFPPDARAGHGHHTASAILAQEAYSLAADPRAYPEQLKTLQVWQPRRVYWNTHPFWFQRNGQKFDSAEHISMDIGLYNPLLGKSYNEIAAESRSMHKSQGFGATGSRGSQIEWFSYLAGEEADDHVLEDIDFSWGRVAGGEAAAALVAQIKAQYDHQNPAAIVPLLGQLAEALRALQDPFWKEIKLREVETLMVACTGLYFEAVAADPTATPGEQVAVSVELINRSEVPIEAGKLIYAGSAAQKDTTLAMSLLPNTTYRFSTQVTVPANARYTAPAWLNSQATLGMYHVEEADLRVRAEHQSLINLQLGLEIAGQQLETTTALVYKRNDPVKGETYRPFEVIPPVLTAIEGDVHLFPERTAKTITAKVQAGRDGVSGELRLDVPEGWQVSPANHPFELELEGAEQDFTFTLTPPRQQTTGSITAIASYEGAAYDQRLQWIEYEHIPHLFMLPKASARVVRLNLEKRGEQIGYLMGAGDAIPESLKQLGYEVSMLETNNLSSSSLEQFDAVILGIRAFNTIDALKYKRDALMDYVSAGGTLIVQYNTNRRLVTQDLAPYPLKLSRDRVTVEEAPVAIIAKKHPVMQQPNKITEADFEGWVQERGLYFPNEWDEAFVPILSSKDPGEERDLTGGLLVAKYGEGYYVYTGYSWFRELPAGVPGAFRIFTNLISLGN